MRLRRCPSSDSLGDAQRLLEDEASAERFGRTSKELRVRVLVSKKRVITSCRQELATSRSRAAPRRSALNARPRAILLDLGPRRGQLEGCFGRQRIKRERRGARGKRRRAGPIARQERITLLRDQHAHPQLLRVARKRSGDVSSPEGRSRSQTPKVPIRCHRPMRLWYATCRARRDSSPERWASVINAGDGAMTRPRLLDALSLRERWGTLEARRGIWATSRSCVARSNIHVEELGARTCASAALYAHPPASRSSAHGGALARGAYRADG